jgi:hypothetical protein
MKALYRHLARGEKKSDALRAAQIDILNMGGEVASPFYWAGFHMAGEGNEMGFHCEKDLSVRERRQVCVGED